MKKKISGKKIGVCVGIVALLLGISIGAVNVGKRIKGGAKAGNVPELPSVEATITDAKEVTTTEEIKDAKVESATEVSEHEKPSTAGRSEFKEDDGKDGKTSESGKTDEAKPTVNTQTAGGKDGDTGNTGNGGSGTTESKPSTTENMKNDDTSTQSCAHAWKEVTQRVWVEPVEHTETVEVVVTPAGYTTEYVEEAHAFCRNCGDMGNISEDTIAHHVLTCQGGNSSYWYEAVSVPVQAWHDAVTKTETKTVIDKEGYYKEEVVSYECTKCGATKAK